MHLQTKLNIQYAVFFTTLLDQKHKWSKWGTDL